ncbi:MAG: PAS domain-containing protein, partial [Bacteroides sp.]
MGLYKNKTKQELIDIIFHLEEQIKGLSLSVDRSTQSRFRELKSQSIFDTLPEMITVLDHSGNIIELVSSPSTNHLEGITSQEIVGSNIKEILPESAYYNIAENMKKVIETSKNSIANHRLLLNGEMHYYENQIFPLDDQYLLCICRDISKRYMAECINQEQQKEITRLNALMGAILDNIPVYLFIKDSGNNFRYLYFNKAFADNSGIPINKAVGKNDYEIFTRTEDMQKFRELDLKVLKEGELSYVEDYETANGDIRFIKTLKKTLRSSTEKPYIIGVSWDITDSKQAERTLVEALTKAEE